MRHWARHGRDNPGAHLRTILHHAPSRERLGACNRARDRARARRCNKRLERAWVGSRFEVWLPCIGEGAPPARDEASTLRLGSGQTVLVVDDANERLLADEEMLAALGYEPVGFTRAHDALAACRAIPKRFDALLVSHIAHAGSALDLAAALHESVPDAPVLLAAARADEMGVDLLVAAGISEVVHRPLISGELASALARCLKLSEFSVGELQS